MTYLYRFLIVIGIFFFVVVVWTTDFSTEPEEIFPSERILAENTQEWHSDGLTSPTVMYDREERVYKMWYVGKQNSKTAVGYGTSDNATVWSEYTQNPILEPAQDWEIGGIQDFEVIKVGNIYHALYTAVAPGERTTHIGYASSPDGITWTKAANNPVVRAGSAAWNTGGIVNPTVVYIGNRYHMWYEGKDSSGTTRFGYATSSNAKDWTEFSQNPVIENIQDWSNNGIYAPDVVVNDGVFEMWFHGYDGKDAGLGRAYSVDGIQWTVDSNNPLVFNSDTYFVDPAVIINNQEHIIFTAKEGTFGNPILHALVWPPRQ